MLDKLKVSRQFFGIDYVALTNRLVGYGSIDRCRDTVGVDGACAGSPSTEHHVFPCTTQDIPEHVDGSSTSLDESSGLESSVA